MNKMMSSMKKHGFLTLLGVLILAYALKEFSHRKGSSFEGVEGSMFKQYVDKAEYEVGISSPPTQAPGASAPRPAGPEGTNEVPSNITGINSSTHGLPPSCSAKQVVDPSELLPKNTEWSNLAPQSGGDGNLQNVNLLKAGHHAGINTVGNSLRNANLQLRSEPPNPQSSVSPWLNTTIEPDLMRVPLELGCGGHKI